MSKSRKDTINFGSKKRKRILEEEENQYQVHSLKDVIDYLDKSLMP